MRYKKRGSLLTTKVTSVRIRHHQYPLFFPAYLICFFLISYGTICHRAGGCTRNITAFKPDRFWGVRVFQFRHTGISRLRQDILPQAFFNNHDSFSIRVLHFRSGDKFSGSRICKEPFPDSIVHTNHSSAVLRYFLRRI